jgi:hypothetical protein
MKERLKVSFFLFFVMDVVSSETEDLHTKTRQTNKQTNEKDFFAETKLLSQTVSCFSSEIKEDS